MTRSLYHLLWACLILSCCSICAAKKLNNTCATYVNDITLPVYVCCEGYAGPLDNCQPVCAKGCGPNSVCKLPEVCECLEGFEENDKGECEINLAKQHLCTKEVAVEYERSEPNPLLNLGNIAEQIKAQNITIDPTKIFDTRMETKLVCCDGFEREHDDDPCLPIDPHMCSKSVEVKCNNTVLSSSWDPLRAEFAALNITFPTDLLIKRHAIIKFCCEGYEKSKETNRCEPICQPKCAKHSKCIRVNECMCDDGYVSDMKGGCMPEVPDFRPEDTHVCSSGDTSEILAGKDIQLSCCPGYAQERKGELCLPQCASGCADGCRCTKPDVCECPPACKCDAGYAMGKFGGCEPICADGCSDHSSCATPGNCKCNEGYALDIEDDEAECVPVCKGALPEFSQCVYPEKWECNEGFAKVLNKKTFVYECQPHCERTCPQNGYCKAPNTCDCSPGYEHEVQVNPQDKTIIENCLSTATPIDIRIDYRAGDSTANSEELIK